MPASGSIQSQPNGRRQQQADDHQNGNCGVGHDVDHRGAHVVVARGAVRGHAHVPRRRRDNCASPIRTCAVKRVRLRNLVDAFQITAPVAMRKGLARAVRPDRLDHDLCRRPARLRAEPKARRNAILEDFEHERRRRSVCDAVRLVMVAAAVVAREPWMTVAVMMTVATAAARRWRCSPPGRGGDRDGFGEMDRDRREEAG